uniref:Uncharacterized protein n=1 Tax=Arundo donax TaxID=35708 RepID=A0A0A9A8F1_ARUDO
MLCTGSYEYVCLLLYRLYVLFI